MFPHLRNHFVSSREKCTVQTTNHLSKTHRTFTLLTASLIALGLFSGCGKETADVSSYISCPFSAITWDQDLDALADAEGENYTTYKSVYGGTTYTYPKEYQGQQGTVKYMFDGDEELVCVAWAYDGTFDVDSMHALYDAIHDEVVSAYGESDNSTEKATNYGDVWHLDGGNILISTMVTSENSALQYAYLSPKVATAAEDAQESTEEITNLIEQNQ